MANSPPPMTPPRDLASKIHEWLSTEGYPLEFLAANLMNNCGFRIRQGVYVRGQHDGVAREIDLIGQLDHANEDYIIRVCQVVECKWSRDKPWVVFTSPRARMTESACAAQAIASKYGRAIMWAIAGDKSIRHLNLFSSPPRPGFSGREAFAKNIDRFYNSMKSVTELTTTLVDWYDRGRRRKGQLPETCVIGFPIILVDGCLFEAYFCEEDQKTKLEEVGHVRCHWKGSPSRDSYTTIDIVTLEFFTDFCTTRFRETRQLLRRIGNAHQQVLTCIEHGSLDALEVAPGARGIRGLPSLFKKMFKADIEREGKEEPK